MLRDWEEFEKYYPDSETTSPKIRRFLQESTKLDLDYDESHVLESEGIPNSGLIVLQRDLCLLEQQRSLKLREDLASFSLGEYKIYENSESNPVIEEH